MFLAEINRLLTLGLVKRLKNSDFILKNKMAELNQNKKSQQPVWPDSVWKLFTCILQNGLSKSIRKLARKAPC